MEALDVDLEHVREHTWLQGRAEAWRLADHDPSLLLRGLELVRGQRWLAAATGKDPVPTALQGEYLTSAQLQQAADAERLQQLYRSAVSRQLAAQADVVARRQPQLLDRSVLLAVESLRRQPGAEADAVLRRGLELLATTAQRLSVGDTPARSLTVGGDGRWVAACGDGRDASIWAAADGTPVALAAPVTLDGLDQEEPAEHAWASAVALHPFDDTAAIVASDGVTRLVSLPDGAERARWSGEPGVRAALFSPDGDRLACVGDGGAQVHDLVSGQLVVSVRAQAPAWAGALSADGRLLIVGTEDGRATVWDIDSRRELSAAQHGTERQVFALEAGASDAGVAAVALSSDGRWGASAGVDGAVLVWPVDGSRTPVVLQHQREVLAVAFGPDSTLLASGSMDGTARVWSLGDWQEVHRFSHAGAVSDVAFATDRVLLTASGDGTARSFDLHTGHEKTRAVHGAFVSAVRPFPDGQRVCSAAWDGSVHVWLPARGTDVAIPHQGGAPVTNVALDAEAGYVATYPTGHDVIVSWLDGRERGVLRHDDFLDDVVALRPVAGALDRPRVLTTCWDGSVTVWSPEGAVLHRFRVPARVWAVAVDATTRRCAVAGEGMQEAWTWTWPDHAGDHSASEIVGLVAVTHDAQVRTVALSADGALLVSGSDDGVVVVTDSASGVERHRLMFGNIVWHVAVTPSGHEVLVAAGNELVVVDARTGEIAARLPHPGETGIFAVDPTGELAVVLIGDLAPGLDRQAVVWHLASRREVTRIRHEERIHAVRFSPDGGTIATASQDRTARLWEPLTGRELVRIDHDGIVYAIALSADSRHVVTGSGDGTARLTLATAHDLIELGAERAGRQLTPEERRFYLPGDSEPSRS
nr:WD40 repeat domain-containing protein [Cellulomonas humilata]